MSNKAVLEGLLFVTGEEGLTLEQIEEVLELDEVSATILIEDLKQDYQDKSRGIRIDYLGNTYKLTTKKEHKDYYTKLTTTEQSNTLSQASLETLAIIAYNEPITRIEIDAIRGVDTSFVIRKLVARNLIHEVGRSSNPGRPILYSTTNEFLDYFGLSTVDDLPKIDKKEVLRDDVDLYESKYKETV